MHKMLVTLGNDEVARLILRQLWQDQDASGISAGRHFRNVLLEAAMRMLPLPDMLDADAFTTQELFDEVESRRHLVLRRLHSPRALTHITRRTLAILILHELREWYGNDEAKNPLYALRRESRFLNAALKLLQLPRGFTRPSSWTVDDILEEAERRHHIEMQRPFASVD